MSKQTETLTDPTRRDFLGTASGAGAMLAAGATGVAGVTLGAATAASSARRSASNESPERLASATPPGQARGLHAQ